MLLDHDEISLLFCLNSVHSLKDMTVFNVLFIYLFILPDQTYANELLVHAKQLYEFASQYKGKYSDSVNAAAAYYRFIQLNFIDSNTDGPFTVADSNSFFSS